MHVLGIFDPFARGEGIENRVLLFPQLNEPSCRFSGPPLSPLINKSCINSYHINIFLSTAFYLIPV